jgi:hypothetical protein
MLKSRTTAELMNEIGCEEGYLYAILAQLKISRKSDYTFTDQDLNQIESVHKNQSKSTLRLSGSPQSQGLTEQAPSSVQDDRPIRKPILRNIQEQYSGAASAELASRKQVLSDRLNRAREDRFQEGVLEELAGEYGRIDGILSVRQGVLGQQQLEQDDYELYRENFVEGEGFLDGTAQKTYTEMPTAPKSTKLEEAQAAIVGIKNWSIT